MDQGVGSRLLALYVNRGFTRNIVGIPRDESDAILAYLYQHVENPLFQCRFRCTENTPSTARCGTTGRTRVQARG